MPGYFPVWSPASHLQQGRQDEGPTAVEAAAKCCNLMMGADRAWGEAWVHLDLGETAPDHHLSVQCPDVPKCQAGSLFPFLPLAYLPTLPHQLD